MCVSLLQNRQNEYNHSIAYDPVNTSRNDDVKLKGSQLREKAFLDNLAIVQYHYFSGYKLPKLR